MLWRENGGSYYVWNIIRSTQNQDLKTMSQGRYFFRTTSFKFLMVRKRYGSGYGPGDCSYTATLRLRLTKIEWRKKTNTRWALPVKVSGGIVRGGLLLVKHCCPPLHFVIIISRYVTIKTFLNHNQNLWFIEEKN